MRYATMTMASKTSSMGEKISKYLVFKPLNAPPKFMIRPPETVRAMP